MRRVLPWLCLLALPIWALRPVSVLLAEAQILAAHEGRADSAVVLLQQVIERGTPALREEAACRILKLRGGTLAELEQRRLLGIISGTPQATPACITPPTAASIGFPDGPLVLGATAEVELQQMLPGSADFFGMGAYGELIRLAPNLADTLASSTGTRIIHWDGNLLWRTPLDQPERLDMLSKGRSIRQIDYAEPPAWWHVTRERAVIAGSRLLLQMDRGEDPSTAIEGDFADCRIQEDPWMPHRPLLLCGDRTVHSLDLSLHQIVETRSFPEPILACYPRQLAVMCLTTNRLYRRDRNTRSQDDTLDLGNVRDQTLSSNDLILRLASDTLIALDIDQLWAKWRRVRAAGRLFPVQRGFGIVAPPGDVALYDAHGVRYWEYHPGESLRDLPREQQGQLLLRLASGKNLLLDSQQDRRISTRSAQQDSLLAATTSGQQSALDRLRNDEPGLPELWSLMADNWRAAPESTTVWRERALRHRLAPPGTAAKTQFARELGARWVERIEAPPPFQPPLAATASALHLIQPSDSSVIAFDPVKGERLWRSTQQAIQCQAQDPYLLCIGPREFLRFHSRTGEVTRVPLDGPTTRLWKTPGGALVQVERRDGTVLYSLDATTMMFRLTIGPFASGDVIDAGADARSVWILDRAGRLQSVQRDASGRMVPWRIPMTELPQPRRLFLLGRTVLLSGGGGVMVLLDLPTGKITVAPFQFPDAGQSVLHAETIGGRILVETDAGRLLLLDTEGRRLASVQTLDRSIHPPLILGNSIWTTEGTSLVRRDAESLAVRETVRLPARGGALAGDIRGIAVTLESGWLLSYPTR